MLYFLALFALFCAVGYAHTTDTATVTMKKDNFYYRLAGGKEISSIPFHLLQDDFLVKIPLEQDQSYRMTIVWPVDARWKEMIKRRSKFHLSLREKDGNVRELARIYEPSWFRRIQKLQFYRKRTKGLLAAAPQTSYELLLSWRDAVTLLNGTNLRLDKTDTPVVRVVSFLFTPSRVVESGKLIVDLRLGYYNFVRYLKSFRSRAISVVASAPRKQKLYQESMRLLQQVQLYGQSSKTENIDQFSSLDARLKAGDTMAFILMIRLYSHRQLVQLSHRVPTLSQLELLNAVTSHSLSTVRYLVKAPVPVFDLYMSLLFSAALGESEILESIVKWKRDQIPPAMLNFAFEVAVDRNAYEVVPVLVDYCRPSSLRNSAALRLLLQKKKIDLAALVILRGIALHEENEYPLYLAIAGRMPLIVELLLTYGNVRVPDMFAGALVWAIRKDNMDVALHCIAKGANIHWSNEHALLFAVVQQKWNFVKLLLDQGVDQTVQRYILFYYGLLYKNDMLLGLFHGVKNHRLLHSSIMVHCVNFNNLELLKYAIEKGTGYADYYKNEAIKKAVSRKNLEAIRLLVESGVDVRYNRDQILYFAYRHPLLQTLRPYIYERGGQPMQQRSGAMIHAITNNDSLTMDTILAEGIDHRAYDSACFTVAIQSNNTEAFDKLFAKYGKELALEDRDYIALYYAEMIENKYMVRCLLRYFQNKNVPYDQILLWAARRGDTKTAMRMVTEHKAGLDGSEFARNATFAAVSRENWPLAEFLLKSTSYKPYRDQYRLLFDVVHRIAGFMHQGRPVPDTLTRIQNWIQDREHGHSDVYARVFLWCIEWRDQVTIDYLLNANFIDINQGDGEALVLAVRKGSLPTVRFLLKRRIATDGCNFLAAYIALVNDQYEIYNVLMKANPRLFAQLSTGVLVHAIQNGNKELLIRAKTMEQEYLSEHGEHLSLLFYDHAILYYTALDSTSHDDEVAAVVQAWSPALLEDRAGSRSGDLICGAIWWCVKRHNFKMIPELVRQAQHQGYNLRTSCGEALGLAVELDRIELVRIFKRADFNMKFYHSSLLLSLLDDVYARAVHQLHHAGEHVDFDLKLPTLPTHILDQRLQEAIERELSCPSGNCRFDAADKNKLFSERAMTLALQFAVKRKSEHLAHYLVSKGAQDSDGLALIAALKQWPPMNQLVEWYNTYDSLVDWCADACLALRLTLKNNNMVALSALSEIMSLIAQRPGFRVPLKSASELEYMVWYLFAGNRRQFQRLVTPEWVAKYDFFLVRLAVELRQVEVIHSCLELVEDYRADFVNIVVALHRLNMSTLAELIFKRTEEPWRDTFLNHAVIAAVEQNQPALVTRLLNDEGALPTMYEYSKESLLDAVQYHKNEASLVVMESLRYSPDYSEIEDNLVWSFRDYWLSYCKSKAVDAHPVSIDHHEMVQLGFRDFKLALKPDKSAQRHQKEEA